MEFDKFVLHANHMLETDGIAFNFNDSTIKRVYAVSGGAAGYYMDAVNAGADIMVTGELKEDVVRPAEECGISLFAAGHYNSEKLGIMALGEHLSKKFEIEAKFIDIPNPV
jgi:putative NIF3 family GTP cyclohydrolase 1 type 2